MMQLVTDGQTTRPWPPFQPLDPTQTPRPVEWVVPGLAVKGCVTLLSGAEKTGKSLLAMQAAAGATDGVTIVDGENGEDECLRRLALLSPERRQRVTIFPVSNIDLSRHMDDLAEVVRTMSAKVLILDTWRSLWKGSEARGDDITQFLEGLRSIAKAYDVAIILLHHVTKGAEEYRGRSEIGGVVEILFTLSQCDGGAERRMLTCHGLRLGAKPAPRLLEIGADGVFRAVTATPDVKRPARPAVAALPNGPLTVGQMNAVHRLVAQGTLSKRHGRRLLGEVPPRWRFWR